LGISSGIVVPLGIGQYSAPAEPDDFRTSFPDLARSPYVLLLSRIHHKKNIEALLQAFSSITELAHYKHWRLVIAGDGETEYVQRLKQVARQCCGDRVVFTGWLDGTRKAAVLQGAALFVLPSYQENFGLSVLEAMANRVPVLVSTHVNLSDEILTAGAGWVVDMERGSLQQVLAQALGNEIERTARGAAAEKLARSHYTWPAVAKALWELYQKVQSKELLSESLMAYSR
jgi:glycosyltransferase involved in cell wall biosynthesis